MKRIALAARIDHTLLKPEASAADVDRLCDEATEWRVVAVCVSPTRLAQVVARSQLQAWRTCAVVGFPSGAHTASTKAAEAREAVKAGAAELDMVVNLGAIADGAWDVVADEIRLVRKEIPAGALKVILETAALTEAQLARAALTAVDSGATFLKTSTGFHPAGGATVEAVATLKGLAEGKAKVKASGGIRDTATALAMIEAGADRIGCSATGAILDGLDALAGTDSPPPASPRS